MKKAYTAPKKVAEAVKKAHQSACGLTSYGGCGKLVQKNP